MADLDKKYFFAVGQKSVSHGSGKFSKVIPIADASGNLVENPPVEFPNQGSAHWTLLGEPRLDLAPPGCLILSGIERSSTPDDDVFQVVQPTLPSFHELLEIVTLEAPFDDPNELLDNFQMRCDHEPTNLVLVKFDNFVYGPLQVRSTAGSRERRIEPDIFFLKPATPAHVFKISMRLLEERSGYFTAKTAVLRDNSPNSDNFHLVHYEAVTGELFDQLCMEGEEIEMVSLVDAVNSISREHLNRNQRRELIDQLNRFCGESQREPYLIERVRNFIKREDATLSGLDELINALLQDERFQEQINDAEKAEVEKRISEKTSTISARAEEIIQATNREIDEIEKMRKNAEATFEIERKDRERNLRIELDKMREESNKVIDRERRNLDDLKNFLENDIAAAVDLLTDERAKILANFISLQPLLQLFGSSISGNTSISGLSSSFTEKQFFDSSTLQSPPALAHSEVSAEIDPLPEDEFFARFSNHVSNCEFLYDHDDLVAFHLSAKEQSPVILCGSAGTGKSSLPVLYAESLAGETAENHLLAIDVNPSWTNPSDLIGYPDAFEHRFIPASSGLFNHLIAAQQSYEACESGAGIFMVCLEELNLAQPEFYFADIMQAISRGPGQRKVSFFDPMAVRPDDPYFPFAKLDITPNVVFVGTMNLDETTHNLSKRLLDRCNLLNFGANSNLLPFSQEAATGTKFAEGRSIFQSDRIRWMQNSSVPDQLVEILECIQPELHTLNCGLTQRRQNSIARFVANSERLCTVEKAIDLQLVQRVVPQIRIHTSGAMNALDGLLRKVEERNINADRTLAALNQLREERVAFISSLDDE